jgi:hypothetical protein
VSGFYQKLVDNIMNKKEVAPLPKQGMISWGGAEIYHRPFVHNSDGTVSTIYGGYEGDDINGYRVRTGISPQGEFYSNPFDRTDNIVATFDNMYNAENFEKARHDREEQRLEYENKPFKLQEFIHQMELADHPDRFNPNGTYKYWVSILNNMR